jgi:preprotein translocase subunit SecA
MRLFKSDWVDRVLQVLKIPDDVPIENKRVTSAIANAQGQVESQNFESRKNVLKYDDVMDRQRKVIYAERREVLEGADLESLIRSFIDDVVAAYVAGATEGYAEQWDLDALWTALGQLYPISLRHADLATKAGGIAALEPQDLVGAIRADAHAAYDAREQQIGEETMRELERRVLLSVVDRKWREHLYEMDYLREGIGLRAYSQRDPLVEYQREGFEMFTAMMEGKKEEAVGYLFNVEVQVEEEPSGEFHFHADGTRHEGPMHEGAFAEPPAEQHRPVVKAKGLEAPTPPRNLSYAGPTEDGEVAVTREAGPADPYESTGRNDKCPCGSGKKFKQCHGAPGGPTGQTARVNG